MPKYEVIDNETGKKYQLEGDNPPTEQELIDMFASQKQVPQTISPQSNQLQEKQLPDWMLNNPKLAGLYRAGRTVLDPVLEAGGLIGGGIIGSGVTPIAGTVAGAGLGYAGAKGLESIISEIAGEKEPPTTLPQGLIEAGKNVLQGAEMEMGGQIGGKVLPIIGKGIKKVYTGVTGLTSMQSNKAVEKALAGSPAFKEAMRTGDQEAVLQDMKKGFQDLAIQRKTVYQNDLDALTQQTGIQIDKKSLMDDIHKIIEKFGIIQNNRGQYVFTKDSNIDYQTRNPIKKLLKLINEFGGETQIPPELQALKGTSALKLNPELEKLVNITSDTLTPKQADNLKQLIDDFYTPSKNARALTTQIRGIVKDKIVQKVPEYETMMKSYQDASEALTEIDKALTLGKNKNIDTALRKARTIYTPINDYRLSQVERLDKLTNNNLADKLAGLSFNPAMPRGFFGRVLAGSPFALGYMAHNPATMAAAPAFSPRVVGELSYLLGKVGRTGSKYIDPEMLTKILMLYKQQQGGSQ